MVIYTKKGDKGETNLFSKNKNTVKVSKSSLKISTIGAIDEANSFFGIVVSFSKDKKLNYILKDIQKDLFRINSILAGANLRFSITRIRSMEKKIDELEGKLPVLKNFLLPGGSKITSLLHYSRTLVRKVERNLVRLNEKDEIKPQILMYINRLSDCVFILARQQNSKQGFSDEIWKLKDK